MEAGVPAEHFTSLAACINVDFVKRSVRLRLGNKKFDNMTKPGLGALMTAIVSVARFVGVSDEHYRQLKRLADKVHHRPERVTERNSERLARFNDKRAMRALVKLPFRTTNGFADVTRPTVRQLRGHKDISTTIKLYTGAETKSPYHL